MCALFAGITGRERWGTFSNVSSKCQLKITRVLEKVRSEGTDIFFFFLTQQCLSDRAAVWHDGIYFVSSLIHSDRALLWISMKDTRGHIHEAQTNRNCPVSLLVFWYFDPLWTGRHVRHEGGKKKKTYLATFCNLNEERKRPCIQTKMFFEEIWSWCHAASALFLYVCITVT